MRPARADIMSPRNSDAVESVLQDLESQVGNLLAAALTEDWEQVAELDRGLTSVFVLALKTIEQADRDAEDIEAPALERMDQVLARHRQVLILLGAKRDAIAEESRGVLLYRQGVSAYLEHP